MINNNLIIHKTQILSGIKLFLLSCYTVIGPILGTIIISYYINELGSVFTSSYINSLLFVILGAFLVAVALLPSLILALIIGFLGEGQYWVYPLAAMAILLATTIGILISLILSRGLLDKILELKPNWHKSYHDLREKQGKTLYWMIFLMRLSPHMPFAFTNLLTAQSGAKIYYCIIFSWLGLIPRTIFAAAIGAGLNHFSEVLLTRSFSDLEVILSITALLAVLILFLVTINNTRRSHNRLS